MMSLSPGATPRRGFPLESWGGLCKGIPRLAAFVMGKLARERCLGLVAVRDPLNN